MIDVKTKRCLEDGCNIVPTFNYKDKKQGLYCITHKKDKMVNVRSKKCLEDECNKTPSYNYENEKTPLYCVSHKKDKMININSMKCLKNECNVTPSYNYKGQTRWLYCASHKKDGMINVRSSICLTPLCNIQVTNKYEGYCLNCFIHLFPDKPNTKNYKTKEKATADYILEQFPIDKYTWITDKRIEDGCSRKRPDLFLDLGYQVIIVEVDENQHQDSDCSCENKTDKTIEIIQLFYDSNL